MHIYAYIYEYISVMYTHLQIGVSKAISEGIHDRKVIPQTKMVRMPIAVLFRFS